MDNAHPEWWPLGSDTVTEPMTYCVQACSSIDIGCEDCDWLQSLYNVLKTVVIHIYLYDGFVQLQKKRGLETAMATSKAQQSVLYSSTRELFQKDTEKLGRLQENWQLPICNSRNSTNRVKLSRKHNTTKHRSSTMARTCALDQIANVKLNDKLVWAIIRAH